MARRKSSAPAEPTLEHRDGCSASAERVDTFTARATRAGSSPVTIARCLDCGAQLVSTTTTLAPVDADDDAPAAPVEPVVDPVVDEPTPTTDTATEATA